MIEDIQKRHQRFVIFGSVAYLAGISGLMLRHNIWFSPDQFFIFAIVAAVIFGRGKKFIQDWAPVIIIFLTYEFFRGAFPAILKFPVHSNDLIAIERFIFGNIPTIELQKKFLNVNHFSWYDFYLSLIYMSYFILPLIFAFYVWLKNHPLFKFLTLAFFVTMYATFITVTFFPAMPPWMASEKGQLPMVQRVLYQTTAYLTVPGALPTFYSLFRGNVLAAMPSMHAELPTLMFIFALLLRKRWLIASTAVYAISVYVAIVYLGEHYVIDAIAGVFYAVAAFFAAKFIGRKFRLLSY